MADGYWLIYTWTRSNPAMPEHAEIALTIRSGARTGYPHPAAQSHTTVYRILYLKGR
jgi:hypothetical protein